MKKSLILVLILVASLLLVSCASDTPEDNNIVEEGTVDDAIIEDDPVDEAPVDETPVEEEPADGKFTYVIDNISEFNLDIETLNGSEIAYDYDKDSNEAEVEVENGNEQEMSGDSAREEIFNLLESVEINLDRSLNDMMEEVLAYFDIANDEVNEFELEIEFNNAEEIDFKYDREEAAENKTVKEFDLDIEFKDRREWDFDYDLDDNEFEITGVESHSGEEAKAKIEELIEVIDLSMDNSIGEMKANLYNHLGIDVDEVEEIDLDIEYVDGMEIDFKVNY